MNKIKDTKKSSQLRKNRGYSFESQVVEKFKENNWESKRLGSASTNLPDVIAVDNVHNRVVSVEAKSTTASLAYVPEDQIDRCINWVKMLDLYDTKEVVLAFKFPATSIIRKNKLVKRKLRYFYKVFPHKKLKPAIIKCNYNGDTFTMFNKPILMRDFKF